MEHLADSAVYSDEVLRRFDAPPHAGRLAGAMTGEAASRTRGSRVRFYLKADGGKLVEARFQALGCPHTIAAASLAAERLAGFDIAQLAEYSAEFLDEELPLPAEKRDIRILIEDAVRACAAGSK